MHRRLVVLAAAFAAPAVAQGPAITDPAQIDQLVEAFTGKSIGVVGGARAPVDRRLRLAACAGPLALNWYGAPGQAVKVSCPDAGSWQIYVNILAAAPVAKASAPIVARGETVTVAVRGRGFTVQRQGEAMEAGAEGDWIKVRTSPDAAPVRARIERPGLVVIPAG
jgi:flagella basal body P-ring formation protein FlgA